MGEIFATFLEANSQKTLLKIAAKELTAMVPPPMNTMLEKQSKISALEKKTKRQSMRVTNDPPTMPCEYLLLKIINCLLTWLTN